MATLTVDMLPPADAEPEGLLRLDITRPGTGALLARTEREVGPAPLTDPRRMQATVDTLADGGCLVIDWAASCLDGAGNVGPIHRSFAELADPPEPVTGLTLEPDGTGRAIARWDAPG